MRSPVRQIRSFGKQQKGPSQLGRPQNRQSRNTLQGADGLKGRRCRNPRRETKQENKKKTKSLVSGKSTKKHSKKANEIVMPSSLLIFPHFWKVPSSWESNIPRSTKTNRVFLFSYFCAAYLNLIYVRLSGRYGHDWVSYDRLLGVGGKL